MSPPRRIHMIGNAHLDPVWLWRTDEGRQEAAATFEAALALLDAYPDFVVTRGDASLYQWLEETHPDLIERVVEHVKAGRWEIVGGWVVQSDTNLPDGESLIRQALYGGRYFEERFGVEVRTAYCVDSFGHPATLPQLLAGCGFDHFVFMRPMKHEKALPSNLFRWRGPDGSEVVAYRIPVAYQTSDVSIADHLAAVLPELPDDVGAGMCFYGVGDHGGGPTREQIEAIRSLQDESEHDIRFGRCDTFFSEVAPHRDRLPTVRGELQNHAVGCYSVCAEIKRLTRVTEAALLDAETLAALAWRHGLGEVDHGGLGAAWHTLLFNQFHDILPGTAVRSAVKDAEEQLGGAHQRARDVAAVAIRRLARRVEVRPPEDARWQQSLIVFNPTGTRRREVIRTTPWLRWRLDWNDPDRLALADGEGNRLPAQLVWSEKSVGRETIRQAFALPVDVPPFGFAVYHLLEEDPPPPPDHAARVEDGLTLSNGLIAATINPATGSLTSLVGPDGRDALATPTRHAVIDDPSDTWGHHVVDFGEAYAAFEAVADPVVVYDGPLTAEIRTESACRDARLIQEFRLDAGARWLTVRCILHWHSAHRLVRFELPVGAGDVTAEVPHGWVTRPQDGREYPMRRWLDAAGLTVANDSKYGCRAKDGVLGLTCLRSPYHAHHAPHTPDPVKRMDVTDQGEHRYAFRLMPHAGPCDPAAAWDLADALNRPLIVTAETRHGGDLGARGSLAPLAVTGTARVTACKKAERDDRLIVRALELNGHEALLTDDADTPLARLDAHQLVTLSIDPTQPSRRPKLTDHFERAR